MKDDDPGLRRGPGSRRPAGRLYRLFLRAYPPGERERYGPEMEETFLVLLRREGERHGWLGRARAWLAGFCDAVAGGLRGRLRARTRERRKRTEGKRGTGTMIGTIVGDIRYALRTLVRNPLFAATVVLTLALGIAVNTSVFTLVDGLLFTPLPYEEPEELVILWAENPVLGWDDTDINPADAWDWRERARSLDDLAVYYEDRLNMTGDGPPELVSAVRTSWNVFDLLGREPVLGRGFLDGEMGEGRDGSVILTHGFWNRRYGADPDVLGSSMILDGEPRTVVGVLGPDFRFLEERPDVFLPLDIVPARSERGGHYAEAVARLAPGVSLEGARTELRQVARQLQEEHPEANENWTVGVFPAHEELLGEIAKQASIVLMVAVGFILLMVCVNVANLLLARAGVRSREMAVRTALGAGRARIVRQLLTESLILAFAGGALGFLLAVWGYRAIVGALPSNVPPVFQFGLDGSVLAFTAAVTTGAALLFGTAPALRAARGGSSALRDGGRSGRSRSSARFGGTLVVLQTAMAVVLLVGGGLLMKSIAGMRGQDFGFEPDNVLTVRISPPAGEYPERGDLRAFWDAVEERVRELPGVAAVGNTQSHPLMGSNWGRTIRIAGREEERTARLTWASGGLFEALGLRVVAGRPLRDTDDEDAPLVAVVDETFVEQYLPRGTDPLSASILAGSDSLAPVPIVGVIHDVVERGVDAPPEPSLYLSAAQGNLRSRSLVVRTVGPPEEIVSAVQDAVWSVDPKIPLYEIETMEALVDRRIGSFALIGTLMGLFALLSLFLGAVGIYGVTAYTAGRRTGEIGVRLAMGAERKDVVRMVVRQGGRRALLGLVLGLALAVAVAGALEGILVGVEPRDPLVFAGVALILAVVSLLGLWIPARSASKVDPVEALSTE